MVILGYLDFSKTSVLCKDKTKNIVLKYYAISTIIDQQPRSRKHFSKQLVAALRFLTSFQTIHW